MVKQQHGARGGGPSHECIFTELDVRKLYCDAFRVDRPDFTAIKTAMGALCDTPFVAWDADKYVLKADLAVVQQALPSDASLAAISSPD
jgi:hypothetical protein